MSSSSDYRKRVQRKGMFTTIIAGVVIVGAVIAIIVAIIALSSKDKTKDAATPDTASQSGETTDATQPTLYRGGNVSPTQPLPTTTPSTQAPTQKPDSSTPQTPTQAPAQTSTEEPGDTPIDPGAAETPADNPDNTGTGAIRSEAPLNTYTDDSGVLHVFTPAGYNWTYQCDGSHVMITCDPHDGQYEFLVTGIAPGSEEIIPQYFVAADKSAWVRVPLTVTVDANLRVTVAG